ncbi:MAG: molybdopterin-dependent oxidoreductase [Anaerolineae bacterium]|nr:molybdopterin-dependent oxidoreductase [Anaerolineae bacterium]
MTIYTPTNLFFQHPVRQIPALHSDYWSLMVSGMVETPLSLSYTDLHRMNATEAAYTLACAGGSDLVGTALWKGILAQNLIDEVELHPAARFACFYAADGYVTSLPLHHLHDALLAYAMNDRPLPPEHGFPLRLVAPARYGYKMPRWIQRIEFSTKPALSVWEQRGWSTQGTVTPRAVITTPHAHTTIQGPVKLEGFAFAGGSSIKTIEVNIDDGPWMPVEFSAGPSHVWTPWSATWTPYAPGSYRLTARAISDSDNNSAEETSHSITFHVTH